MKEMLITSSVLILAMLLLRFLFRRTISRRVQYALWLLVALRLLIPANLPAMEHNVLSAAEPVSTNIERSLSERLDPPLHQALSDAGEQITQTVAPHAPSVGVIGGADGPTVIFVSGPALWLTIFHFIHFGGVAVMALWFLAANLRFARRLRRTRVPLDGAASRYPVYLCDDIPSPCLFGLLRPAVYVTSAAAKDETRLRYVIAHEETHARHLDPLWSLVRSVCLAVWWFDPLVWLAAYCAKADCELACDEGMLARLGEAERVPYGETLLSLVPVRRGGNPLLTATTMTAGKRQMKERIQRIAEHKRPLTVALVALLTLTGIVCAATFTGAKPNEPEPSDFSTGGVIQGTIFGTITDVWNEDGKTLLRVHGNTEDAVTLTLIDSTKIDPSDRKLAVGQVVTACYELHYGAEGINDYKPLISVVIADEQLIGAYANVEDYIDAVRAKLTSMTYYASDGSGEKSANVLDTRVALLQKRGEVSDLVPEGTLELYRYRLETKIDVPLADVALAGGMYAAEDGWCDLEGQGGHALIVLRRADGSVDVLRDAPCNDDMGGIWHYQDSESEALYDWAVQYYDLDLPLYSVELSLGGQNKVPANRVDGNGWYLYVPVRTWWYREDERNTARWYSRYDTGSTISIREASREELAADRPQLADGQKDRFVEAPDGRIWRIWTQYDPALLLRSDMTGLEPAVLDAMAESFTVIADSAAQGQAQDTASQLRSAADQVFGTTRSEGLEPFSLRITADGRTDDYTVEPRSVQNAELSTGYILETAFDWSPLANEEIDAAQAADRVLQIWNEQVSFDVYGNDILHWTERENGAEHWLRGISKPDWWFGSLYDYFLEQYARPAELDRPLREIAVPDTVTDYEEVARQVAEQYADILLLHPAWCKSSPYDAAVVDTQVFDAYYGADYPNFCFIMRLALKVDERNMGWFMAGAGLDEPFADGPYKDWYGWGGEVVVGLRDGVWRYLGRNSGGSRVWLPYGDSYDSLTTEQIVTLYFLTSGQTRDWRLLHALRQKPAAELRAELDKLTSERRQALLDGMERFNQEYGANYGQFTLSEYS